MSGVATHPIAKQGWVAPSILNTLIRVQPGAKLGCEIQPVTNYQSHW